MDYKKFFKEKLSEFFDDKLKHFEKKAMEDLKELEIMKYELNDIYEGKKSIKLFFIDNQNGSIIENFKNKKLFYTYFDEEKETIELQIENTNNFSFEPPKKDNVITKANSSNANTKNSFNGKSNPKTPTLSFNQIKSLEEILRLKESQLRNKLQNNSNALLYSSNIPQATYRTLSNYNLTNEKLLNSNNTQAHLFSQLTSSSKISDRHSGKNLSSKLNNLSSINNNNKSKNSNANKPKIFSNSPKAVNNFIDEKLKTKLDFYNNNNSNNFNCNNNSISGNFNSNLPNKAYFSEAVIKKQKNFTNKTNGDIPKNKLNSNNIIFVNSAANAHKHSSSRNNYNITNSKNKNPNFPVSEKENSDFENLENFENGNYEAENLVLYRSLSPKETKFTSNFCDGVIKETRVNMGRESLTPSTFMNNINININHLNSGNSNNHNNHNNHESVVAVKTQHNKIKINKENHINKSCDLIEIQRNQNNFITNAANEEEDFDEIADDEEEVNLENALDLETKTNSVSNKNEFNNEEGDEGELGNKVKEKSIYVKKINTKNNNLNSKDFRNGNKISFRSPDKLDSEKFFSPSQRDFNKKQALNPPQISSNFNQNATCNANNINNDLFYISSVKGNKKTVSNMFKNYTNQKKPNSHSLTLQEMINKKLQNHSISNLPGHQQKQGSESISNNIVNKSNNNSDENLTNMQNYVGGVLEHSFSNVINVNVNLENERKTSFGTSSSSNNKLNSFKENKNNNNNNTQVNDQSVSSSALNDKTIFNQTNTCRAEGSSLTGFPNEKGVGTIKLTNNTSHKKTHSLNNGTLFYSTPLDKLSSNSLINNNKPNNKNINSNNLNIIRNVSSVKNTNNYLNNKNNNQNNSEINNKIIKEREENSAESAKLDCKSKSKSKPKQISHLRDLAEENSLIAAKPLNTSKAGYHRTTKSHNNLDFLKSEKKVTNKAANKKEQGDPIIKKTEAKERKANKSSGKLMRREPNLPKKIRKESNKSLEIKTNLTAEDLEIDINIHNKTNLNKNFSINNINNEIDFESAMRINDNVESTDINNVNNDKNNKDQNKKNEKSVGYLESKSFKERKSSNNAEKTESDFAGTSRKSINKPETESNQKVSKINRSNSIVGSSKPRENIVIPKSNYRNSQITNSKNPLATKTNKNNATEKKEKKAEEEAEYPEETRGKSDSIISSINPRKAALRRELSLRENSNLKQIAESIVKHSSFGDFNAEFVGAHRFSENFQSQIDLKNLITQSKQNPLVNLDPTEIKNSSFSKVKAENENENNLSHHSIHSITSVDKFISREKAKFHEEINKTIEKEIKKDSLINDINISMNNAKENNLEGKKYTEMINNIFLDDNILHTESAGKSVDTEERCKLITPKFSPLNYNNGRRFEFGGSDASFDAGKVNKQKALRLLLKSGLFPLQKTIQIINGSKLFLEDKELIKAIKQNQLKLKINSKRKFITDKLGDSNLEKLGEGFTASKISKNGLSLFTKNEENELKTKEQPIEITNFFKFVSLVFENKFLECDKDADYIKIFFEKFLKENLTLKNTLIELSSKLYLITDEHYENIVKFVAENPDVILSTSLLRKNRSCSYISFMLKEIHDYYTLKSPDDYPVYKLRNEYKQILMMQEQLNSMEPEFDEIPSFKSENDNARVDGE